MTNLESGSRQDFLGKCRDGIAGKVPEYSLSLVSKIKDEPLPVDYSVPITDAVVAFTEAATAVGALVYPCSRSGISKVIDDALDTAGPGPVAITDEPQTRGIVDITRDRGREVILPESGTSTLAQACLGITGTVAGIARSGTIAVDSAQSRTRLVSALPRVHLAILEASSIVHSQREFLQVLEQNSPSSNVVLITGPSRSADIELILTVGVHGPGKLMIALLKD